MRFNDEIHTQMRFNVIFSGPNQNHNFFAKKIFPQKIFTPQKIFPQKKFTPKNFYSQKVFTPKARSEIDEDMRSFDSAHMCQKTLVKFYQSKSILVYQSNRDKELRCPIPGCSYKNIVFSRFENHCKKQHNLNCMRYRNEVIKRILFLVKNCRNKTNCCSECKIRTKIENVHENDIECCKS